MSWGPSLDRRRKRGEIHLTIDGETGSLTHWMSDARVSPGLTYSTIAARVCNGWDAIKAISTPCAGLAVDQVRREATELKALYDRTRRDRAGGDDDR